MDKSVLTDYLINDLRELYNGQRRVVSLYSRVANTSSTTPLRRAFFHHVTETEDQIMRLVDIFGELDILPSGKSFSDLEDLVKETHALLKRRGQLAMVDTGIIAVARRVENYEVSRYQTAYVYADALGRGHIVGAIQRTIQEESRFAEELTEISPYPIELESTRAKNFNDTLAMCGS